MYDINYHVGELVTYLEKEGSNPLIAKVVRIKYIDEKVFQYGLIFLNTKTLKENWGQDIFYADVSQVYPLIFI